MKSFSLPRYLFIIIIPLIILIASFMLRSASGPFWQYSDPSYMYLFNALNMVKGHPPSDISHPGTPLQLLVLLFIWFFNAGLAAQNVLDHVLTNPEFYLSLTYMFLVFFSLITSILLAIYTYRKTRDIIAVFLIQLPGLTFLTIPSFTSPHTIIPIVANVSPEPMLIGVVNLFNLSFLMLFFAKTPREEWIAAFASGFVCGLGVAIKLTFLPLLTIPLIIISWRIKPFFMIIVSASFILWTLPIIPEYPVLWKWITALLTHTGYDGRGDQGIVDWHKFFLHYLKDIIGKFWFYLIPVIGIFVFKSNQLIQGSSDRTVRFLCAVTLGVLLQTIMVAKHFQVHYLVPGMGLCGSVFFLFYIDKIAQNKHLKQLVTVFMVLFILLNITHAAVYRTQLLRTTEDLLGFHDKVYSKYPNCAMIASKSNAISLYLNQDYGLFLGNNTSDHVESEDLARLFPHSFYFNAEGFDSSDYGYGIWNAKRVFADDILASCPCAIFLSGSDFTQTPYETRLIERSKYANAYLLVGSTEKQASVLFSLATELLQKGKYPEAFVLAMKSRDLNFQPRGEVEYLLTAIYSHLQQK